MRKENEADAYEDIAYENDLSLSPLFKNLHLEVVRELLDHYCGQGDANVLDNCAGARPACHRPVWRASCAAVALRVRGPVDAAPPAGRRRHSHGPRRGRIARKNQQSTTIYSLPLVRECVRVRRQRRSHAATSARGTPSACCAKCRSPDPSCGGPRAGTAGTYRAWRRGARRWGRGPRRRPAGCPEF